MRGPVAGQRVLEATEDRPEACPESPSKTSGEVSICLSLTLISRSPGSESQAMPKCSLEDGEWVPTCEVSHCKVGG